MIYDVRESNHPAITGIVFSEEKRRNTCIAHTLTQYEDKVKIVDSDEYVFIVDKEHAENLIKALHKAIELGWLK